MKLAATWRRRPSLTLRGATIHVPAGRHGVEVTASDVTLDGLMVTGAQFASFNGSEMGIHVSGTLASPLSRVRILNSTVSMFGHGGLYLRHLNDFEAAGNTITDTVYAGIQALSALNGRITANTVKRVGVGLPAGTNAYGIAISAQATADPMSADILVDGNTVETVQTWEAMDTHGGQRITFSNNIVRFSRRGVMITTGANGQLATDGRVIGNQFLSPVSIPAGDQYAVVPVNSVNLTVTGNTITGWGNGRDLLRRYPNTNLVYSGNTVDSWEPDTLLAIAAILCLILGAAWAYRARVRPAGRKRSPGGGLPRRHDV